MALDVLLPPHCPCCGAGISAQGQICAGCFAALNFIVAPLCRSCGLPFANAAEAGRDGLCGRCRARPPAWSRARAAFLYDDASRRLILPLKYADRQENALVLGRHMARAAGRLLDQADLLVPVPLHRWRLFRRGFNQAALLARALQQRSGGAGRSGRPVCLDMLQRTRRTRVLGMLSAAERAAELAGAISVRPSRISLLHGKRVVLVDDVLTTGATIGACARALLDAGASHIDVLVAARVADPRVQDEFGDGGQDDEMDEG
jgi:ComF family protein